MPQLATLDLFATGSAPREVTLAADSGLSFFVPGPVVGKARPRIDTRGRFARMHQPDKTISYESLVKSEARLAMDGRKPFEGPVWVSIVLRFPVPQSFSAKKRAQALAGGIRPLVKPDLDNVCKSLLDACNAIVYVDDKQVVEARISKRYDDVAGAHVEIYPL